MFFVCERRRSRRLSKRDPQRAQRAQQHRMAGSRCSRRRSEGGDGGTRFSVPSAPTKTAATQRTSQRAERAIKHSAIRKKPAKQWGGRARGRWRHKRRDCHSVRRGGRILVVLAADLKEEIAEHAFPFRQLRRR